MFADHRQQVHALNRIEGQIRGIRKMVEDQRYCVDILAQTKAVKAAIGRVERQVFEAHVQHCVKAALTSGDRGEADRKISEIMSILDKQWT